MIDSAQMRLINMKPVQHHLVLGILLLFLAAIAAAQAPATPSAKALPAKLSDAEFWKLVSDISEPDAYFRIVDNFTSNESEIGGLFTQLRDTGVRGGVYLGVGPEQNLTYIAAIRPSMAFVVDIRRQAVMQHLMFKAAFEMSKDRADFISLLFSIPKPVGLEPNASIQEIWNKFLTLKSDRTLAVNNHALIVDRLTKIHQFTFTADESDKLEKILNAFVTYGPSITTQSGGGGGGGRGANALTFADLTGWSVDAQGVPQSFLSSDENFQAVKSLEDKNLLIPVSGDFGGSKALRAIGTYLKDRGATVSAFYVSNVEQYLFMDGKQSAFYENVAALPLSDTSVFIRPYSLRNSGVGVPLCPMIRFVAAARAGRVNSNNQALTCPQ